MSNHTIIETVAEHTEICFGKDIVRRNRIDELQKDRRKPQGVASISDGILPMLLAKNHIGIFQGIDHEKAMCDSINNHRPRHSKPEGDCPGIDILPALHMDVAKAFHWVCQQGNINLYGLWDIDLTATARVLFREVMPSILHDAAQYRYRGRIVITSCCRGDRFSSFGERAWFIRAQLPEGIDYVTHESYNANYQDRHRVYHRRAPMCQYILQGRPR